MSISDDLEEEYNPKDYVAFVVYGKPIRMLRTRLPARISRVMFRCGPFCIGTFNGNDVLRERETQMLDALLDAWRTGKRTWVNRQP